MTEERTPLGIHESWAAPEANAPGDPLLKNWLLDTGSLTERLQSQCLQFEVEVLFQDYAPLEANEVQLLFDDYRQPPEQTQVREVLLRGNEKPWVFARSLLPKSFLTDGLSDLANLGKQPLGKIIFNDSQFKRQAFELVECQQNGYLPGALNIETSHTLWGRRSLFHFKQFRIMVAEIFLPGSPAYSNLES